MMDRKLILHISILFTCFIFTACTTPQNEQDLKEVSQSGGEPTSPLLPEPTQKSSALATLENMEPIYEIFFDGAVCRVEGPDQITPGEQNFILHNSSDLSATLWVAEYKGEGSYEDHLAWREQYECAHPGARCEDEDGNLESYAKILWMNPIKQANEGTSIYYRVYDLTSSGEYLIYIGSNNLGWLCMPFSVGN